MPGRASRVHSASVRPARRHLFRAAPLSDGTSIEAYVIGKKVRQSRKAEAQGYVARRVFLELGAASN